MGSHCCSSIHNHSVHRGHAEQQNLIGFLRQTFGYDADVSKIFSKEANDRRIWSEEQFVGQLKGMGYDGNPFLAFAALDSDSDSQVTLTDLESMVSAQQMRERVGLRVFREFVSDNFQDDAACWAALGMKEDDVLTEKAFVEVVGNSKFKGDVLKTFRIIDSNRSGELTFDEFKLVMTEDGSLYGQSQPSAAPPPPVSVGEQRGSPRLFKKPEGRVVDVKTRKSMAAGTGEEPADHSPVASPRQSASSPRDNRKSCASPRASPRARASEGASPRGDRKTVTGGASPRTSQGKKGRATVVG